MRLALFTICLFFLASCGNSADPTNDKSETTEKEETLQLPKADIFALKFQRQHAGTATNDVVQQETNEALAKELTRLIADSALLTDMPMLAVSMRPGKEGWTVVHFERYDMDGLAEDYPNINIDVFAMVKSEVARTIEQSEPQRSTWYCIPKYSKGMSLKGETKLVSTDMVYTSRPSMSLDDGKMKFNFGNYMIQADSIVLAQVKKK